MPNTGPSDGSRSPSTGRLPIAPSPSVSDTAVVVLPSPAFVGVIPATQIRCPSATAARTSSADSLILAFVSP